MSDDFIKDADKKLRAAQILSQNITDYIIGADNDVNAHLGKKVDTVKDKRAKGVEAYDGVRSISKNAELYNRIKDVRQDLPNFKPPLMGKGDVKH